MRPVRSGGLQEITNAPQSGTGQIDPAATTSSRSSQSSSITASLYVAYFHCYQERGTEENIPDIPSYSCDSCKMERYLGRTIHCVRIPELLQRTYRNRTPVRCGIKDQHVGYLQ
jgi:hypothetical protein